MHVIPSEAVLSLQGSLTCSRKTATALNRKSVESSRYFHTLFLLRSIHLNIILLFTCSLEIFRPKYRIALLRQVYRTYFHFYFGLDCSFIYFYYSCRVIKYSFCWRGGFNFGKTSYASPRIVCTSLFVLSACLILFVYLTVLPEPTLCRISSNHRMVREWVNWKVYGRNRSWLDLMQVLSRCLPWGLRKSR